MSQICSYVNLLRVEGFKVVLVPPVVCLALGDVARFDMDGCFCVCAHDVYVLCI